MKLEDLDANQLKVLNRVLVLSGGTLALYLKSKASGRGMIEFHDLGSIKDSVPKTVFFEPSQKVQDELDEALALAKDGGGRYISSK